MVENVIQIKIGITINVDVSVKIWKNIMCMKKIIFSKYYSWLIYYMWWNYRYNKNSSNKLSRKNGNLKNKKILYFTQLFINYHNIIENRTCYYFDDRIRIEVFDFDNSLMSEKSYINFWHFVENIDWPKNHCVSNGFIRVYNGTRYLFLFGPEKYDATCNRIRCLIGVKVVLHMLFFIIMQISK